MVHRKFCGLGLFYFQKNLFNSNCGDFCSIRRVGRQRTVTSWKYRAMVFAPGFGSMDRRELPAIPETSKALFVKAKLINSRAELLGSPCTSFCSAVQHRCTQ